MTKAEEAPTTTTERGTVQEKELATNSKPLRIPATERETSKINMAQKSHSAVMVTHLVQEVETETTKDANSLLQSPGTEALRVARRISKQITKGESLMIETTVTKVVRVASQTTDDKINLTLFAQMRTDRQDLIID